jgi:hypothetical protein
MICAAWIAARDHQKHHAWCDYLLSLFLIYEFIGGFLGAIFDVSVSAFLFYTPAYPARPVS